MRGAELDHAGHPHRRAGGGGQSVHGSRAGSEVTAGREGRIRKTDHRVSCFPIKPLNRFNRQHSRAAEARAPLGGRGGKNWKGP